MTVTTDARPGKARERTCIGCRKRSGPADLLRMTVSGGLVLPDPDRRAPGRGAHLHPVAKCLDLAERRKAFPRAFRVPGPLELTLVRDHVAQCSDGGSSERSDSSAGEVTKAATRPPATTVATT